MSKTAKIYGTDQKPRVCVFRSNKYISAQVIDDAKGVTLLSKSSQTVAGKQKPVDRALETGKLLGAEIKAKKIAGVVFDRNSYRYQGQVKSLADGIREAGIKL